MNNKADIKFNNGNGARVCNECSYIISYGYDHTPVAAYCGECWDKKQLRMEILEKKLKDLGYDPEAVNEAAMKDLKLKYGSNPF